jgi:transcriptional regulator with XRE-family HTH domain
MHSPLGLRLRELRAERGISLRDAARITGVDRDTIRGIELGERHPFDRTLGKLAKGYGIPLRELLMESEESPGVAEKELVPLAEAPQTGQEEPPASRGQAPPSRTAPRTARINALLLSHLAEAGEIESPLDAELLSVTDVLGEEDVSEALAKAREYFMELREGLDHYCARWEKRLAEDALTEHSAIDFLETGSDWRQILAEAVVSEADMFYQELEIEDPDVRSKWSVMEPALKRYAALYANIAKVADEEGFGEPFTADELAEVIHWRTERYQRATERARKRRRAMKEQTPQHGARIEADALQAGATASEGKEERRSLLDDHRVRELLSEQAGADFGLLSDEEFLAYGAEVGLLSDEELESLDYAGKRLEIDAFGTPSKLVEAEKKLNAEADKVERFLRSPVQNQPLQKLVAEIHADELRHLPSGRQLAVVSSRIRQLRMQLKKRYVERGLALVEASWRLNEEGQTSGRLVPGRLVERKAAAERALWEGLQEARGA